jgi:multiple sugar transport system permease protein
LQAFSFFRIGHASAVVMVFFVIIVACSLSLLVLRQRMRWT